jgi:c-di-AMP phosphodiesterase-like protein
MNEKLSRLLEPGLKVYFFFLLVFSVVAIPFKPVLGIAECCVTVVLYIAFTNADKKRRQGILRYIDNLTGSVNSASKSTLINSPLPIMVFRPDTGEVIWSNENFMQLVGVREHLFESKVSDAMPEFPVQWLLEGKQECPERVRMGSRSFRVYGSVVRAKAKDGKQNLVATTYWMETTEADDLRAEYAASRPVVAILQVDNYEELMKACGDTQRSAVLAQIDEKLNQWADNKALLIKTDRDHYLLVFEEQYYEQMTDKKFAVLDAIRDIKVSETVHPTMSIGVGKDGDHMTELYKNANLSVEMALSRGGDQAVVRNRLDFEFYGGRAKTTEKRTKVKSRVMANALGELMQDARQIFLMGHGYADMDCVGAAAGLCCIARKRGRSAQIIIDLEKNAAGQVLSQLQALPEYKNVFISPADAFLRMQPGALLIVLDTNRPDFVESQQVLESCNRVAVIDHHRRAASYIENAALNFHEPYASSTAELVTEVLQYLAEPTDLLHEEAEALLAGIVLDTKHFAMRTGGRTFEAAAFLRRAGADMADVQRLFQNDLQEVVTRYDIMRRAEVVHDGIAVVTIRENGVDRVAAAQAADELLTLKGITASFVLYRMDSDVMMSARSLGDVNVQVILEALGGGGNSTTAGGRVEGGDPSAVREQLLAALDTYFEQ